MPAQVLGRDGELEAAERFLDAVPLGLTVLLFDGPPGIGKTTLWSEAARRAERRGYRVLTTRPAEAEARLSFSGLADLVATVEQSVIEALPAPQRDAFAIALARAAGQADRRALFAGFVSLLQGLASTAPTVLAVDDLQWLDRPSSAALEFALRRLTRQPIGVLVTSRSGAAASLRSWGRSGGADRLDRVVVGPLSVGVLHHLIKGQLGRTLPRPTLVRIEQASRGNPFYALEIAREIVEHGGHQLGESLPVPSDLRELVRARIRRLGPSARDALLAAAMLAQPSSELVDVDALEPADDAGIVVVDADGRVGFTHPLYAAAVSELAGTRRRREVHRDLAAKVPDPEERARHLALATQGPDAGVAELLSKAAAQALARGAQDGAAELEGLALRLTPLDAAEDRLHREIALCTDLWLAGDLERARSRLERVLEVAPAGDLRSQGLVMLGVMRSYQGDNDAAIHDGEQALAEADSDAQRAEAHAGLAFISQTLDIAAVSRHAHAALALFDEQSDPAGYSWALLWSAYADLQLGRPADEDAFERGAAIQGMVRPTAWKDTDVPTYWALARDDLAAAQALASDRIVRDRQLGEETLLGATWSLLALIHLFTGDWPAAAAAAQQGLDVADLTGRPYPASALHVKALVAAHRGDREVALETAKAIGVVSGEPWTEICRQSVLGFLALSEADHAGADRAFALGAKALESMGIVESIRFRVHGDHIEAAIGVGDVERAESLVERVAERSRVFPHPWTLAIGARGRALALAARGHLDRALAALEEALEHHVSLEMPFELARTQLVKGEVHRRRREKRLARESIGASLAAFELLGAPLWAARARGELARVQARRAPMDLTPTEEQIAALAAAGHTNREIAAALFMSPKTVEKRLASVYGKFGIGTRAELGRRMAQREVAVKT